jgi:hypothetical protein
MAIPGPKARAVAPGADRPQRKRRRAGGGFVGPRGDRRSRAGKKAAASACVIGARGERRSSGRSGHLGAALRGPGARPRWKTAPRPSKALHDAVGAAPRRVGPARKDPGVALFWGASAARNARRYPTCGAHARRRLGQDLDRRRPAARMGQRRRQARAGVVQLSVRRFGASRAGAASRARAGPGRAARPRRSG